MSTRRSILIVDKFVKITVVYGKRLTKCEKFRGRAATWHDLQKKEMDGFASRMKRESLYTSEVVGGKTIHIGYVKQELYSM